MRLPATLLAALPFLLTLAGSPATAAGPLRAGASARAGGPALAGSPLASGRLDPRLAAAAATAIEPVPVWVEFVDKGGHFHVYFETHDAAAMADVLKGNGVEDVHETAWGTREFVIKDDHGHTLYFGESL